MDERTTRFIETVQSMRNSQKTYFSNIAKVKKSKMPADFAAASNALKSSKALEVEVDRILENFLPNPLTKVSKTNDTNH